MGDEAPKIVVGVDGSPGSRAALRWAVGQAAATGARVDAVLAYRLDLAWIDVGSEYEQAWVKDATERAEQELDRTLADTVPEPGGVALHPVVVEGPPADVLVERGRHADLLVVGSRGHGGFTGLLLGSVSQRCVERAPCPVVVVPTG